MSEAVTTTEHTAPQTVAPHQDCPPCPRCQMPCGVPAETKLDLIYPDSGVTLICSACGRGWIGTPDEVAQAGRAQAAWDGLT